jgi:ketosteroid isomerase-like protein
MPGNLPPDQREVFEALQQVWDAMGSRQWDRLRSLMSEDFVCVGAGLTERLGRDAFLVHLERDAVEVVEAWELSEPIVQLSPGLAVIYARFHSVTRIGDLREVRRGHTVDIFRREGNRWLWAGNVYEPTEEAASGR